MRLIRSPRVSFRRSSTSGRSGRFRIWPLVIFGIFAFVYYQSNQQQVPVTGRAQLVDLSIEQEAALGLQSYASILSQSHVLIDGPEVDRVKRIGRRIAAVTGAENFEWEFNVIQSDQANAFCLPGGKVAVYTGILPIAGSDDGLATVISHEIAHAVARHGAERMAHARLSQLGTLAVGMSVSDMDPGVQRTVLAMFGLGSQFGIQLPFSRSHESEADYIGLTYLAKACFNPAEAPDLWRRMGAQGTQQPELLSTHPASATRVQQFADWMPEAMEIYQKNCDNKKSDLVRAQPR